MLYPYWYIIVAAESERERERGRGRIYCLSQLTWEYNCTDNSDCDNNLVLCFMYKMKGRACREREVALITLTVYIYIVCNYSENFLDDALNEKFFFFFSNN